MPNSNQLNLGVRQVLRDWTVSATYAGVRGYDQLYDELGEPRPQTDGTLLQQPRHRTSTASATSSTRRTTGKTWYDALQVQIDRPYQRVSPENWVGASARVHLRAAVGAGDGQPRRPVRVPERGVEHSEASVERARTTPCRRREASPGCERYPRLAVSVGDPTLRHRHVRREVLTGCGLPWSLLRRDL